MLRKFDGTAETPGVDPQFDNAPDLRVAQPFVSAASRSRHDGDSGDTEEASLWAGAHSHAPTPHTPTRR
jgi:hypothetical protein